MKIQQPSRTLAAIARRTKAGDHKPVPLGAKAIFHTDGFANPANLVVAEFDHLIAFGAMQVVMRGVAVIVFVGASIGEAKLPQQAGFHQQAEGAIDRRAADPTAGAVQVGHEFIGIEVLMGIEDMADKHAPGLGELFAANLQEFAELLLGRLADRQRHQRCVIGHGGPSLRFGTGPTRLGSTHPAQGCWRPHFTGRKLSPPRQADRRRGSPLRAVRCLRSNGSPVLPAYSADLPTTAQLL